MGEHIKQNGFRRHSTGPRLRRPSAHVPLDLLQLLHVVPRGQDQAPLLRGLGRLLLLQRCKATGCKDSLWGFGGAEATCCFVCKAMSSGACHFPHFEACASDSNGICKFYSNMCCIVETCACWVDKNIPLECSCCGKFFKEDEGKDKNFKIFVPGMEGADGAAADAAPAAAPAAKE